MPIMPTRRAYTRYENQIYLCDPQKIFRTDRCLFMTENSICSFPENNGDIVSCPGNIVEGPTDMTHHYLRQKPNLRMELPIYDYEAVSFMEIEKLCYMLRKIISNYLQKQKESSL